MSVPDRATRERRWSAAPPAVPGIYLQCSGPGSPVSRFLVEPLYGRLVARLIGEDDWIHVRAMSGWWCLEEEAEAQKQTMEAEELMRLDWLP